MLVAGLLSAPALGGAQTAHSSSLAPAQVESLVLLGRVWGFVKYHHPRVTSGGLDWDAELRGVIPRVLSAPTTGAARDTIDAWLARVGDPPPCTRCATEPVDPPLRADIDWIRDERALGAELSARLQRIHFHRATAEDQRYVHNTRGAGNADFSDESTYADDALPPADLRLLAVFRLWNALEYWFPYRHLMAADRVALLHEFVPLVWAASDVASYRTVVVRLATHARDTHVTVIPTTGYPPPGELSIPVQVRWVEGRFVVGGYTREREGTESGLRPGDVLLAVDGAPVDSLARVWTPYFAASNDAALHRKLGAALTRGARARGAILVERDGRRMTVDVDRVATTPGGPPVRPWHDRSGDTFQRLTDDVAYVKLSTIAIGDVEGYVRDAATARVLVIDIRGYPSAFVVFALGNLLAEGSPEFVKFTVGNMSNPGSFRWTAPGRLRGTGSFHGRLVILVDEATQSAAEYTAMAFRVAPGAIVVGSTTAGADGNVSILPLPGGLRVMFTGLGVYYPDGRPTQQIGIVPDLVVLPTIRGLRDGRDEVLEAGVSQALGRPFRIP